MQPNPYGPPAASESGDEIAARGNRALADFGEAAMAHLCDPNLDPNDLRAALKGAAIQYGLLEPSPEIEPSKLARFMLDPWGLDPDERE